MPAAGMIISFVRKMARISTDKRHADRIPYPACTLRVQGNENIRSTAKKRKARVPRYWKGMARPEYDCNRLHQHLPRDIAPHASSLLAVFDDNPFAFLRPFVTPLAPPLSPPFVVTPFRRDDVDRRLCQPLHFNEFPGWGWVFFFPL